MTSCFAESYERRYQGLLTGLLPDCGLELRWGDSLLGQALHIGQLAGIERLVDVAVAVDGQRPGHDLTDTAPAGAPGQGHMVRRPIDSAQDRVAGTAGECQHVGSQWRAGKGGLPVRH